MIGDLKHRIASLSDEQRTLLARRVRAGAGSTIGSIARLPRVSNEFALSSAQERLWFIAQLDPTSPVYHVPACLRLRGGLDVGALRAALWGVVGRHEALRTCFPAREGRPVQLVLDRVELPLPRLEVESEREAERLAGELAAEPFDLARAPLLRAQLLRLGEDDHLLVLCLHHIVFDGWSLGVLLGELSELYNARRAGRPPRLAPLAIQYPDYAVWQRQQLQPARLEQELGYWRTQLAGAPELLELPADRPRPAVRSFRGGRVSRSLPAGLSQQLNQLAQREQTTLFIVLLAGLQALLARLSGQLDLSIGTPVAGREHPQTEPLIGFFANTLVLRAQLDDNPSFRRILRAARTTTLDALSHQTLPFEQLVEHLHPERTLNRTPLFQIVLNFQNAPLTAPRFDGLEPRHYELHLDVAKFDLLFEITPSDDCLDVSAEYSADLFEAGTVERLLGHLQTLLAGAVGDPEARLARLPLLSGDQRRLMLFDWNRTGHDYPRDRCIHELFEEQAQQRPDAPALFAGGKATTYAELNRRADQLALTLRSRGARPGRMVVVQLGRSPELVCALLAVLKTGAAYVPLDPALPPARVDAILRACGAHCLISERPQLVAATELESAPMMDVIVFDDNVPARPMAPWRLPRVGDLVATAERCDLGVARAAEPGDPAYVIFTSGSTGAPKGVLLQHAVVVNTIDWVNRTFGIGPRDRLLFVTSPMFDLSVYDIFGVLAAGGSIRIAREDELEEPARLAEILRDEPITFWDSAPAALQQLVPFFPPEPERRAALRLVFLSGDWIPFELPDAVRTAFPTARVVGLGGATEAAIWSNYHDIGERDPHWASVPYGRPIQNARYYVLDDHLEPMPIGVAGELYIGGACLAAGYLGQPVATAERFVPDPFGGGSGARLYRTGDRARYHADGRLEFLGRLDNQLKIRGYRVEPAEIEGALRRHPQVAEAIVTAEPGPDGSPCLTAYVTPADPVDPPTALGLRSHIQRHLPRYMHPSRYHSLDRLPLTANGKLDRANLPAPAATTLPHTPARTQTERRLAGIWATALARDLISVGDNFFELGGHSLLAVRVVSEVAVAFEIELPLRTLFESQTLAELAERVDELRAGGDGAGIAPIEALPRDRYSVVSRLLLREAQR